METLVKRCLVKAIYYSKQRLWCIFPMKQATRSFCWLICKWWIVNYTIQRLQLWKELKHSWRKNSFILAILQMQRLIFFLQKCNVYCLELKIAEIALGEIDEKEEWEQQHYINCIYFKIQHWFITLLLLKIHINVLF